MIQFDPNESLLLEKFTIQSYQRNNLNEYKNNSRFLGFNNIRNKNGLLYYDKLDNLMPLRNASSKSYSGHSIGSSISMDVEEPRVNAKFYSNNNSSSDSFSSISSSDGSCRASDGSCQASDSSNLIRNLKHNLNGFLSTKNSSYSTYTNRNVFSNGKYSCPISERYCFENKNINISETIRKTPLCSGSSIKIRKNSSNSSSIQAIFVPNQCQDEYEFSYLKESESFDKFLKRNKISNFVPFDNLNKDRETQKLDTLPDRSVNYFNNLSKLKHEHKRKHNFPLNNKVNKQFKLVSYDKKLSNMSLKVSLLIKV